MSDEALFFEIGDARRRVVKGMILRKVRRGVLAGVITVKWEIHRGLHTIYQDLYYILWNVFTIETNPICF